MQKSKILFLLIFSLLSYKITFCGDGACEPYCVRLVPDLWMIDSSTYVNAVVYGYDFFRWIKTTDPNTGKRVLEIHVHNQWPVTPGKYRELRQPVYRLAPGSWEVRTYHHMLNQPGQPPDLVTHLCTETTQVKDAEHNVYIYPWIVITQQNEYQLMIELVNLWVNQWDFDIYIAFEFNGRLYFLTQPFVTITTDPVPLVSCLHIKPGMQVSGKLFSFFAEPDVLKQLHHIRWYAALIDCSNGSLHHLTFNQYTFYE